MSINVPQIGNKKKERTKKRRKGAMQQSSSACSQTLTVADDPHMINFMGGYRFKYSMVIHDAFR